MAHEYDRDGIGSEQEDNTGSEINDMRRTLLKLPALGVLPYSSIQSIGATEAARSDTISNVAPNSKWTQAAKLVPDGVEADDFFGKSVDVSSDGTTAIVGASAAPVIRGTGDAYIFIQSNGQWSVAQELVADDEGSAFFGISSALNGDGTTAVVGDFLANNAYVFTRSDGQWNQSDKLTGTNGGRFGRSVDINGDGTTIVIGAPVANDNDDAFDDDRGAAYVFKYDGSAWNQTQKLTADDPDAHDNPNENFGFAVALTDGTLLIGKPGGIGVSGDDAGAVYAFAQSGGQWTQMQKLTADDEKPDAIFGQSIDFNRDGARTIIGAREADNADGVPAGAAYVFEFDGSTWSQIQKLTAGDGAALDAFGHAVALDGNAALVGDFGDDANGENAGAAYVFEQDGDSWTETPKLTPAESETEGDFFGEAVALLGETAFIGAPRDNANGGSAGATYIFETSKESLTPPKVEEFDKLRKEKLTLASYITENSSSINEHQRVEDTLLSLAEKIEADEVDPETAIEAVERMMLAEDLGEVSIAGLGPKETPIPEDLATLIGEDENSVGADPRVDILGNVVEALFILILALLAAAASLAKLASNLGTGNSYSGKLLDAGSKADDLAETFIGLFGPAKEFVEETTKTIWKNNLKDSLISAAFETGDEALSATKSAVEGVRDAAANDFVSRFETDVPGPTLDETFQTVDTELGPSNGGLSFGGGNGDEGPSKGAANAAESGRELIISEIKDTMEEIDITEVISLAGSILSIAISAFTASGGLLGPVALAASIVVTFFSLTFTGLSFVAGISGAYHLLHRFDATADAIINGDSEVTL